MTDLSPLAHQAANRSAFIASRLAELDLDDTALATRLGCTLDDLTHLRLCSKPRPDHFREDIERIATHVHADKMELAHLIDPVEHLRQLLHEYGFTGKERNDRKHNALIFQQGEKRLNIHLPFLEKQTAKQVEGTVTYFMQECQQ